MTTDPTTPDLGDDPDGDLDEIEAIALSPTGYGKASKAVPSPDPLDGLREQVAAALAEHKGFTAFVQNYWACTCGHLFESADDSGMGALPGHRGHVADVVVAVVGPPMTVGRRWDALREQVAEALLTEYMDGDFLVGAGRTIGNEGGDVGLNEARTSEVAWWATDAVLAVARLAPLPDATIVTEWGMRLPGGGVAFPDLTNDPTGEGWHRAFSRRPGSILVRRTVTSYADRVGPWEPMPGMAVKQAPAENETRVHNHAPWRPVCNERRLQGGQLRGACLDDNGAALGVTE